MNSEINWRQNCLTSGVHDGRTGTLWGIPLGYAVIIFKAEHLHDLVIERIYSDALQLVEYGEGFTQEWADKVRERSEQMYRRVLQHKVGELNKYYESLPWETEQTQTIEFVKKGILNPHYEPLHGHDTINLLCRIIGVSASR